MSFSPSSVEAFAIDGWDYDAPTARLSLHYRLPPMASFTETITFNGAQGIPPCATSERAFDLVCQLAGVSYFKAAMPGRIHLNAPISQRRARFLERTYANGLGELAFTNQCVHRLSRIRFNGGHAEPDDIASIKQPGMVIPIGGGKDSLVTVDRMQMAGYDFRTISVGNSRRIAEVVEALGTEHIRIDRRIDPALFELNRQGAINGHVPISAILASIMTAAATLYGFDTIVMSNERSAEEPNVVVDGVSINHQYSKSLEFERDYSEVVRNEVAPDLRYFSALRPFSELAIARRFSTLTEYHGVFSSCNSNFRLQDAATDRWCRHCPKCRFVFLALAPFMPRAALTAIFDANLLDMESEHYGYRELLGLEGHKPFECVGEIAECRAAWNLLIADPEWSSSRLLAEIGPLSGADSQWPHPSPQHNIPSDFSDVLDDTL